MNKEIDTGKSEIIEACKTFSMYSDDYSEMLNYYKLGYKIVDYYLQVGEITKTQGWIIHLSVTISQLESMLQLLLPVLIDEKVSFKLGMNKVTCANLLLGYLGKSQVGKVLCLYPESDNEALRLAQILIKLTQNYKGPAVPTDICLGTIVYTRYGSFNPVMLMDASGREERYIYDPRGNLAKDDYTIPFQIPKGINWPFSTLTSPIAPAPKRILKNIYKPLKTLKSDLKGDVSKGLYLKGLFRIIPCVIKQGRKHMASEESGRDIYDRLHWQKELHDQLFGSIPLPQIFDFFQEGGDSYLVMEFINGDSLQALRKKLNPNYRAWSAFESKEAVKLIDLLIVITSIIEKLHQKGYVHRDIAPGNFLVDKTGNIYLIDIELAYSLKEDKPNPPFELGTPGFISPEQYLVLTPTSKEDVYGLGALTAEMLTGLSPSRFDTSNPELLCENLNFFIENQDIAQLISTCLDADPEVRPSLSDINNSLNQYRHQLINNTKSLPGKNESNLNTAKLKHIISCALDGINNAPIVVLNDLWYSKVSTPDSLTPIQNLEYARYPGIREGLSGILYLLARAKKSGISINSSMNGYLKSWEFIETNHFTFFPNVSPGLYDGSAGFALALVEGMDSGLLEDNSINRYKLQQCLDIPNNYLDISKGIAGQGIALLQCATYMDEAVKKKLLDPIIEVLLRDQQDDGSWILADPMRKKNVLNLSFGHGILGIIWFLLAYYSKYQNNDVRKAVVKSLHLIIKRTHELKYLFIGDIFHQKILGGIEKGDERKGILLCFIKAYEVLGDDYYKKLVVPALASYPSRMVRNDYTQESGMAGLGELFLEAFRAFKDPEWQVRANWLANVYMHTCFRKPDDSMYWLIDENNSVTTADFMVGISGIIHFLLRCLYPEKIGYRIVG